jgi:hypothetical protein
MQLHYSTASGDEVKHALAKVARMATVGAKVVDIETARRRRRSGSSPSRRSAHDEVVTPTSELPASNQTQREISSTP